MLPKYLIWNRHEVLQCALILGSPMRSFAGLAIARVKNFEPSHALSFIHEKYHKRRVLSHTVKIDNNNGIK